MQERDAKPPDDAFPAIDDYALIGDCGSAALVSRHGSVDWLCLPHFDSPSIFAALLDRERGGSFRVAPTMPYETSRRYVEGTAVLETTFRTGGGVLRLRDCMVADPHASEAGALWPDHQLLRELRCVEGHVEVEVVCDPRFEYGTRVGKPKQRGALGIFFQSGGHVSVLRAELPLELEGGCIYGRATLRAGERRFVLLAYDRDEPAAVPPLGEFAAGNLQATIDYWRGWSGRCAYQGALREDVVRSAITLKLMTSATSGAVVAAPTTSLPERIGGVRNWDYRYCWLRDASFTLHVLFELGYVEEGSSFFSWLLHATNHPRRKLRVLYNVFGGSCPKERELTHLSGYRGSRPVRVGNAARGQLQLDVYGELLDAAHEYVCAGGALGAWSARLLAKVGDATCDLWTEPDDGIWEVRSERRRRVHSLALCWVALDRLIGMHEEEHLSLSARRLERFRRTRDEIRAVVEDRGWSERLGSYVAILDGEQLDASLLLLALYGYTDPRDPRMAATFERVRAELSVDGLMLRYRHGHDDGLPAGEGAFVICSFWAVEYLARAGRVEEAEAECQRLCEMANDVGLFAEELDPRDQTALGNFPQAFSHVGLISAALAIGEARGERDPRRRGRRQRDLPRRVSGAEQAEDLSRGREA